MRCRVELGGAPWTKLDPRADGRAHGPPDLNALHKRMREVSGYLREDAAALEALVGEPVMLRVVTTAGRERSPHRSPHRGPEQAG